MPEPTDNNVIEMPDAEAGDAPAVIVEPTPRFVFELTCMTPGTSEYRLRPPLEGITQLELSQHLAAVMNKLLQEPHKLMIPTS